MTTPNTTYDNANNHHNLQQLPLIAVRDVIIFHRHKSPYLSVVSSPSKPLNLPKNHMRVN